MRVALAGVEQCGKCGDVDLVVAGRIELDSIARNPQKRACGRAVAKYLAEIRQRLAQVVARVEVGLFGPQQAG
jgi:hypothetical protein